MKTLEKFIGLEYEPKSILNEIRFQGNIHAVARMGTPKYLPVDCDEEDLVVLGTVMAEAANLVLAIKKDRKYKNIAAALQEKIDRNTNKYYEDLFSVDYGDGESMRFRARDHDSASEYVIRYHSLTAIPAGWRIGRVERNKADET